MDFIRSFPCIIFSVIFAAFPPPPLLSIVKVRFSFAAPPHDERGGIEGGERHAYQ
jgi:hypothetical protein